MADAGLENMTQAAVLEAIYRGRFSCRGFQSMQVPQADIDRILTIAQLTPSWCNSQPWRVIVTMGAATEAFRAGLLTHAVDSPRAPDIAFPEDYRGAYKERRRACGLQLYLAAGVAPGDRAASARQARENFRFFGAPHVAIITTEAALGTYGALDCGGYVTSFTLAAQSLGVASIAQASLAAFSPFVRGYFKIPEDRLVVCGISFGYADKTAPANGFRTSRAAVAETVDWVS